MNERIRELAREAGYYLYDLTETHGMKTVETDSEDEWVTLEKFAELIVRECAEVAGCNAHVSGFTLGDMIKEHFGIK